MNDQLGHQADTERPSGAPSRNTDTAATQERFSEAVRLVGVGNAHQYDNGLIVENAGDFEQLPFNYKQRTKPFFCYHPGVLGQEIKISVTESLARDPIRVSLTINGEGGMFSYSPKIDELNRFFEFLRTGELSGKARDLWGLSEGREAPAEPDWPFETPDPRQRQPIPGAPAEPGRTPPPVGDSDTLLS